MVEARSGRRFAVFFLLAAFVLLLLGRWLAPVNRAALSVAAPFGAVVNTVATDVSDTVGAIFDGGRLRQENTQLKKKLGLLIHDNIQLLTLERENAIFKRMLRFSDDNSHLDLFGARVLGYDSNALSPSIIINHGSRDGLRPNMTVLDPNGYLVGTISDVTPNSARVLLILNPSSSVGAMDLKTQALGTLDGEYAGPPKLDDIATRNTLHVGDLVVTSGQYNLYPRNILLGQIVAIQHHNYALFQSALVRPAADFAHLDIVTVVRSRLPVPPVSYRSHA